MTKKADIEGFVSRAEELNTRISASSLRRADKFLDPKHWVSWCDNTAEFYNRFHDLLSRSLSYLLVHNEGEQPNILKFMMATDLEKSFPRIDMNSATYAHVTLTIKYIMARVLMALISKRRDFSDLETRANAAFEALWALPGEMDHEYRQRWQAYEAMLDLAFGNYDRIIAVHESEYGSDLAKYEDSDRTIIKQCYMLSRIATGGSDDDLAFGATSFITLLRFNYYLWRVGRDASAEIGLVPLVLICHLHEAITKGTVPNQHDFYSAMAPRVVLDDMDSLKRA